jgi:ribosomal protein S27AE
MMKGFNEKTCPRCGRDGMKRWNELTSEEKILAARLPMSAEYAQREREMHLFCPRCWHEEADANIHNC